MGHNTFFAVSLDIFAEEPNSLEKRVSIRIKEWLFLSNRHTL